MKNTNLEKYIVGIFWAVLWCAIVLYMQVKHAFHFPYIEQSQMFLFDGAYLSDKLWQVAGVATIIEEFFTQFFYLSYIGPIFVATALLCVGVLSRSIIKRIAPNANAPILWLTPITLQIATMVDYDYQYSGIISYIMAAAAIRIYLQVEGYTTKVIISSLLALLLYWAAGPAAVMFIASIVTYELLTSPRKAYFTLLPMALVAIAGWIAIYYVHLLGEVRYAFTPDLYYKPMLRPTSDFYYAWVAMPIICAISVLLRHRSDIAPMRKYAEVAVQLLFVAVVVNFSCKDKEYLHPSVTKFKELDYYLRNEQWDDVLQLCKQQGVDNTLHILIQNIALVQTDALGDKAFAYTQLGLEGITMDWSDNNPLIFSVLSDLHFALGNTSIAQEVAFKKNSESIAINHSYNPRMLKRLVQTNIIYGGESGYDIAEKYIAILEKSLRYREWATEQRVYLDDKTPLPTMMLEQRQNMHNIDLTYRMAENFDLLYDISHCNLSRRTFEHQCVGYLLNMDLESFHQIVSRVYGTATMPKLPQAFAEALLIYSTQNKSIQGKYSIDETTHKRFLEFQNFAAKNYNNRNLASIMRKSYGETYWYYYMFTK